MLEADSTSFIVVTTLEDVPFEEARFFVEKLREAGMHLAGAIVNKVLPPFLLDRQAHALARRLATSKNEAESVLANNYLTLRTLALRDRDLLGRVAELGTPLLAQIPRLDKPVHDLEDLLEVGELFAD